MPAISIILGQILLLPLFAIAAKSEVPVVAGDRLVLRGLDAQVSFVAQGGNSLKVAGLGTEGVEGEFVLEKKGNVIEIHMNEISGKKAWLSLLSMASSRSKKIEISGPALPVEVHLHGGSVDAQKWHKDMKVSMTQGRVAVLNGGGALQIYVQKGDISVAGHSGKVNIDSYSGNTALKNIEGDVETSLFAGQMQIEKVRGFISLSTSQSTAKVNQGNGTLQFESGKGSLVVQGFQGRVEGQSQGGAVNVDMPLDSEVDIKTKSGKVVIKTPPGSGATLNLLTVDGDISIPPGLRVTKLSSEKSVRGRLGGKASRVSVFVRSQEGTISVK